MADYFQTFFKCIFLNENVWILSTIWLKFVPKGPIDNNTALQDSHGSLYPGKVLIIEHGSLGTGKVPSFQYFLQKVQEKSLFFADRKMNVWLSDINRSVL